MPGELSLPRGFSPAQVAHCETGKKKAVIYSECDSQEWSEWSREKCKVQAVLQPHHSERELGRRIWIWSCRGGCRPAEPGMRGIWGECVEGPGPSRDPPRPSCTPRPQSVAYFCVQLRSRVIPDSDPSDCLRLLCLQP